MMSCANNNVWCRTTVNNKGKNANECMITYPDDLFVRALDPGQILSHIEQHLKSKDGFIEPPTRCPGAELPARCPGIEIVD